MSEEHEHPEAASEGESSSPPPRWRQDDAGKLPPVVPQPSPRRKVAVGVLGVLGLGLVGYLVLLWLRPVPQPLLFTWTVAEYPNLPLASIPFAVRDRTALADGPYFARPFPNWQGVSQAAENETVVVYLCGRARVDEQGGVVLLDSEVEPGSVAASFPLRKVLQTLAASRPRHQMLILDLAWPIEDAYLADSSRDLPQRVLAELEKVKDARRLCLLSCAPGQTPLTSPDLGRSVFSYYLEEGLRGWADFADAPGDRRGTVTARRLAQFVQARVDRWAQQNRQTRQTPMVVGDGADFALVALPRGVPLEHLEAPGGPTYPEWLTSAWKTREQWWGQERHRRAAWLFRQLELCLMQAERDWIGGADEKKVRQTLQSEIDRLEKTYAPIASAHRPDPQSLGALGVVPDGILVNGLQELLRKIADARQLFAKADEAEKAVAKLLEEFAPRLKGRSEIELAGAVFETVATDPFPRRGTIQLLDRLLDEKSDPRFAETVLLRRLARLADTMTEEQWPVRPVRKILELTRRVEAALGRGSGSHVLGSALDAADRKRHEAEVLFFNRGFASLRDAESALDDALAQFNIVLGLAELLERGQAVLDEALAVLPDQRVVLERTGGDDKVWLDAVRATGELAELLLPREEAKTPPPREELRQKADEVMAALNVLRRPLLGAAVAESIQASQGPDAGAAAYQALESLLSLPSLAAEDRPRLWKACRALGKKLVARTFELDQADADQRPAFTLRPAEVQRFARKDLDAVPGRARRSVALMELAGIQGSRVQELRQKSEDLVVAENGDELPGLAFGIERTWTEHLPTQFAEQPARARERLARTWPGWLRGGARANALIQATVAPRRQKDLERWAWLAGRYLHESQAPEAPAFAARAAFAFRDFAPPASFAVRLPSADTVLPLDPAKRTSRVEIPVTLATAAAASPVRVAVVQPDPDWLEVKSESFLKPDSRAPSGGALGLPVEARLLPGAELSTAPRPLGFLVELKTATRTYYHRVRVPGLPDPEKVELILSADPGQPTAPIGDLRLRIGRGKQAFYLYARNGTDKTRTFDIELRAEDRLVSGGAVSLTLAPQQVVRVPFPGVPPGKSASPTSPGTATEPPVELPPLEGPLNFRLVEKGTGQVLAQRQVNVNLALPREYVRIPSIRFTTGQGSEGKNRLEVTAKAATAFTGPPCVMELVLPPARIPGLITIRDGVFRGELPQDGKELKLYASDLVFEPGADENGFVYVHADGVARAFAFRTTFARFGEPTTPQEDLQPALRVVSDRYFRTGGRWEGQIEVDNPPTGATLEVSLGRFTAGEFEAELRYRTLPARQKGIGFGLRAKDGAIEFEPYLKDWKVEFDSVGVRGERLVRARLLGDKETEIVPPAYQTIVFADHVPEQVAFVDLPKQVKRDVAMTVQASGIDKGAGIKEVIFFVGQPTEDNKLPTGVARVVGTPVEGKENVWEAKLPLPPDKKGDLPLTVQFTNRVGLSAFARGSVELVEFDPVANARGVIQGNVVEGELVQPGLVVTLLDAKGGKLAERKSEADGAFRFDGVPPGSYFLNVVKPSSQRRATRPVMLLPGQTVRVRLELFL